MITPEKSIEKAVCRWAKNHDIWSWKLTIAGWTGLPDRLFIYPNCRLVFIEFKATGKKATPLQSMVQEKLRRRGFEVHTVDNKEDGIRILNEHI